MGGVGMPGETILLVEDEEVVRNLARRILERRGYRVLAAGDGREALEIMEQRDRPPVDLVLSDVVMPGLSGPETVERLRSIAGDPFRVLFMSGYTEDHLGPYGVLDRGIHFLPKPFDPISLSHRVREILDG